LFPKSPSGLYWQQTLFSSGSYAKDTRRLFCKRDLEIILQKRSTDSITKGRYCLLQIHVFYVSILSFMCPFFLIFCKLHMYTHCILYICICIIVSPVNACLLCVHMAFYFCMLYMCTYCIHSAIKVVGILVYVSICIHIACCICLLFCVTGSVSSFLCYDIYVYRLYTYCLLRFFAFILLCYTCVHFTSLFCMSDCIHIAFYVSTMFVNVK